MHDNNFFIRELSLLEFNKRVIEQASDKSVPILERLKYLCIADSNLDEFFEIKVAFLRKKLKSRAKIPPVHNFLYCWTEILLNIENIFKNCWILYFHPPKTGQETRKKCIFSRFLQILGGKISKFLS